MRATTENSRTKSSKHLGVVAAGDVSESLDRKRLKKSSRPGGIEGFDTLKPLNFNVYRD